MRTLRKASLMMIKKNCFMKVQESMSLVRVQTLGVSRDAKVVMMVGKLFQKQIRIKTS